MAKRPVGMCWIAIAMAGVAGSPARPLLANSPPAAPIITEPSVDGRIVNPADVHMETLPFSDPDPGDTHLCSDWEIWLIAPAERVWAAWCVGGLEKIHAHMGDGTFQESHAGQQELRPDTDYRLRVRHRDSSGNAATEWSLWAERLFTTGPLTATFPMELDDVLTQPVPTWVASAGVDVVLPPAGTPPSLRLESAGSALLLEFRAAGGAANQIMNPPPLPSHVPVRVRIGAGSLATDLILPASRLRFTDHEAAERTIYLPIVAVSPGQETYFWVSANGSTFHGTAGQTEPDFSSLARGAPVPWTVLQPGYVVEVVATGFQLPVNIAFHPNPGNNPDDPYYYVTELYGTIKVVRRNGVVSNYAANLLNFNPTGNFPGSGEQGLAGIAVDPATGDVFAGMLYDSATNPGTHFPKVVRFTSNDGGLTAATQTTILDMVGEAQGQSHQISNFSIGPDGKLYVHMGDGFVTATSQNLNSFRGKILRMNLSGTPAADNPFYDPSDGINSRDFVYAYGVRNPFGGAWRASDGFLYCVENGPSVDRMMKVVAGRNYLWNGTDASMYNYALYVWNPAHAPVNIAFIQPGAFGGSGFPPGKMGHAFVTESGPTWATGPQSRGKRIVEFMLDPSGNLVSGPTKLVEYNGSGKATAVGLAAGPDGLYFTDLYKDVNYTSAIDHGANVLRVRFVGQASFTADVNSGLAPLHVQFADTSDVVASSEWLWQFGDGTSSTLQHPAHTYTSDGVYDVTLRVTGSGGVSVVRRNAFIRVGASRKIAFIGGSLPLNAADTSIVEHLRSRGFTVTAYDDERTNRPSAATLAAENDLIIASSTILSGNVGADFAPLPVPLIHWEQALNRSDREPLAGGGNVASNVLSINILNNTHPIMAGLSPGITQVFSPAALMSVANGPYGPGVSMLATRAFQPADAAVMAAEAGAALLGGQTAPARRVFLFLEDNSWLSATPAARQIFEQAVLWALGMPTAFAPADFDRDRDVDADDLDHLRSCTTGPSNGPPAPGCENADLDGDGDVDQDDFAILQRCLRGPGLIANPSCGG